MNARPVSMRRASIDDFAVKSEVPHQDLKSILRHMGKRSAVHMAFQYPVRVMYLLKNGDRKCVVKRSL